VSIKAVVLNLLASPWSSLFSTDFGDSVIPPPPPPPKPSPNRTVVYAGSSSAIIDGKLNRWTIVSGVVKVNGRNAGYTSGVIEITYVNGVVWQQNDQRRWWSWTGTYWMLKPGRGAP
jgi:hypothetical protein